ncbi:3-phosphoshikimate 1-carboxyvinyltransferase [bacterium]|nr:3-phosphoshikimate 1-carboxyvinyltransferase [bacterium]
MKKIVSKNTNGLNGCIEIPADKSISHRAAIFSALAKGTSIIKNFSNGADPLSSLKIMGQLGASYEFVSDNSVKITSNGSLKRPSAPLDCGNSGTTMRLISGILAGQNFKSTLIGDESLSKRPMKRIIEPLTLMGAKISSNNFKAPINISGCKLGAIDYNSRLASAQVKSCILLAGLHANGETSFTEPYLSRNHTEIMLEAMGANIRTDNTTTFIQKSELKPLEINICGDISSAAYFIVAGLIVPNSDIILKNVGLNPTRTGIIDIIKQMGAEIEILDEYTFAGENAGDLRIRASELKACTIEKDIIPRLIDELPIIAVLATQANGNTIVKDAQDLRNKESDRIKAIVTELSKIGANITETEDGFIIQGKTQLSGDAEVECYNDHRLAMSLYVAGLICQKPITINGFEWVNISFPTFEAHMNQLSE